MVLSSEHWSICEDMALHRCFLHIATSSITTQNSTTICVEHVCLGDFFCLFCFYSCSYFYPSQTVWRHSSTCCGGRFPKRLKRLQWMSAVGFSFSESKGCSCLSRCGSWTLEHRSTFRCLPVIPCSGSDLLTDTAPICLVVVFLSGCNVPAQGRAAIAIRKYGFLLPPAEEEEEQWCSGQPSTQL